jgi:hypothetical protein
MSSLRGGKQDEQKFLVDATDRKGATDRQVATCAVPARSEGWSPGVRVVEPTLKAWAAEGGHECEPVDKTRTGRPASDG